MVVGQVNFLKFLGNGDTIQNLPDSFVSQLIAGENQLLELALLKDEDLKKCTGSFLIDSAIAQRKRLDHFIRFESFAKSVAPSGAKHIMV